MRAAVAAAVVVAAGGLAPVAFAPLSRALAAPPPSSPASSPPSAAGPLAPVAVLRVPGPLSPRVASYVIDARLDERTHTITARERVTWRNDGAAPTGKALFHVYLDAFRNQDSVFLRESHGAHRLGELDVHGWSAVDVTSLRTAAGVDLLPAARTEGTILTVALPRPVAPGETLALDVAFTVQLPKVFARSGWAGPFTMGAQWFPKLAVYACDRAGRCEWHADEYHAETEFFADWGTYDVTLDLPGDAEVAATGVRTADERRGDRRVVRYRAEDVHDFAFATDPRFRVLSRTVRDGLGELRILLYALPGHDALASRHLDAAALAVAEIDRRFGAYPYGQLTVVDVPDGDAADAGGMEYPTLVTTLSFPTPASVRGAELVTVHEVGHQVFYGLVGSDEAHEPWLDEGLCETFTMAALEAGWGTRGAVYDFAGRHLSAVAYERLGAIRSRGVAPVASPAWGAMPPGSGAYAGIIYSQSAVLMRTLEGHLGRERFDRAWRRYVDRWRFRHPSTDDFVASFDEGAGEDLRWFLEPALRRASVLDYEVLAVRSRPAFVARGLYACPATGPLPAGCREADRGKRVELDVPATGAAAKLSEVVVRRVGDLAFPVTVEVGFTDGTTVRESWDGRDAWHLFEYRRAAAVAWAEVDPDRRVPLDVDQVNNGLRAGRDGRAAARVSSTWAWLAATLWQLL